MSSGECLNQSRANNNHGRIDAFPPSWVVRGVRVWGEGARLIHSCYDMHDWKPKVCVITIGSGGTWCSASRILFHGIPKASTIDTRINGYRLVAVPNMSWGIQPNVFVKNNVIFNCVWRIQDRRKGTRGAVSKTKWGSKRKGCDRQFIEGA